MRIGSIGVLRNAMRAVIAVAGAVVLGAIGAAFLVAGACMTVGVLDGGPEPEIGNSYLLFLSALGLLLGLTFVAGAIAAFRARS